MWWLVAAGQWWTPSLEAEVGGTRELVIADPPTRPLSSFSLYDRASDILAHHFSVTSPSRGASPLLSPDLSDIICLRK
jgi:hypothetical protein